MYTRQEYLLNYREIVQQVCKKIVGNLAYARMSTIDSWWRKRKCRVPSGSTTLRMLLEPYRGLDDKIASKDRPNKKAITELLPSNLMTNLIRSERLPYSIARRSTKYEPGRKHRALLYASDDLSTLVAAYASENIEKNMDFMVCAHNKDQETY